MVHGPTDGLMDWQKMVHLMFFSFFFSFLLFFDLVLFLYFSIFTYY
jgi:hypothetical protein